MDRYVEWLGGKLPATPNAKQTPNVTGPGAPVLSHNHNVVASQVGIVPKADPDGIPSKELPPKVAFAESRDVGEIIRKVAKYTVGNPREVKRMVNLARLYLFLRNVRRRNDETWRSPDIDQYARLIALTLHWPDMMRWLQWGADEASWEVDDQASELVVRRLRILEFEATNSSSPSEWRQNLSKQLHVPIDSEADWACDPKLFDFFKHEGQQEVSNRLSAGAQKAFW
jgi:hypothetical protein